MAAPKGNEFWKLRSKHGRDALFASPELLEQAAIEYFKWCLDNPLISIEVYGKDAVQCSVPKMRPFTIQGLCMYCDADTSWWRKWKSTASKDFFSVISRIEDIIYRQKFEGAAAGFLNANIISRDLGLAEKTENKNEHGGELIIKGEKFADKDR